jgi:integrase
MSKGKTVRVERRTLANGTVKEYRYQPRLSRVSVERTVSGVIAAWQRSPEWSVLRASTQTSYVRHLQPLHNALKLVPLTQVQRRHIMAIRDEIAIERGHGVALVFCRVVSAFFGWALEREYLNASPATNLARKLKRGEWPTWRDDQAQLAMRELPESYRRVIVLAYHIGQRRGDLCALRWSDYNDGYIWLTQQKTNEVLKIPVVPKLAAELDAWKADRSGLTILEHLGKPWRPEYLSQQLPKYLEAIGLPRQLGLHGVRKLTAARYAESGASTKEIGSITGHKTLAMIERYTKGARQQTLADIATLRLVKSQNAKK